MMRIYYFLETLFASDWTDVCVNCPLERHTINFTGHEIEFAPFDLVLDLQATGQLIFVLVALAICLVPAFLEGYRGKGGRSRRITNERCTEDLIWKHMNKYNRGGY